MVLANNEGPCVFIELFVKTIGELKFPNNRAGDLERERLKRGGEPRGLDADTSSKSS